MVLSRLSGCASTPISSRRFSCSSFAYMSRPPITCHAPHSTSPIRIERQRSAGRMPRCPQRSRSAKSRQVSEVSSSPSYSSQVGRCSVPLLSLIFSTGTETTSADDPALDTRLTFIRRQSGLDYRAALFVLSPVSPGELSEFIKRFH
jgi:hypothetical protein